MASSDQQGRKGTKRSKAYFRKCSTGKRNRWETKLDAGMKGVLVTCNRDERQCVRESYDLLNEYADELYGREVGATGSDEFDEGDIADVLNKEVAQMNEQRTQKKMRFQAVDSRAKNVIFIRTKIEDDPANLIHHVLTKMKDAGKCKSKHIQRILPVSATCRATLDQIEKGVKPLLEPYFHTADARDSTFAVLFKTRNNNQVRRGEVITVIANAVTSGSKCTHSVDLDDPDYSILVEVVCNVCCLSVLKDYDGLKKYNVRAIVGDEPPNVGRSKSKERNENGSQHDDRDGETDNIKPAGQEDKITCVVSTSPGGGHRDDSLASKAQDVVVETKPIEEGRRTDSSKEPSSEEEKGTKEGMTDYPVCDIESEESFSEASKGSEEGETEGGGIRIF